jgi:hypothetical protein
MKPSGRWLIPVVSVGFAAPSCLGHPVPLAGGVAGRGRPPEAAARRPALRM